MLHEELIEVDSAMTKCCVNSTLILIKPAPGLASKPAGIDHFDQQWAGPVFGITEARLQHAHDVEADVESDEVRQGQRTHRMRHAQA